MVYDMAIFQWVLEWLSEKGMWWEKTTARTPMKSGKKWQLDAFRHLACMTAEFIVNKGDKVQAIKNMCFQPQCWHIYACYVMPRGGRGGLQLGSNGEKEAIELTWFSNGQKRSLKLKKHRGFYVLHWKKNELVNKNICISFMIQEGLQNIVLCVKLFS